MVSKVEFETIDTRSLELESIISHMTIIFEVRTIYRLRFKYEEAYLTQYNNIREARSAIGKYIHTYNFERRHSALEYQTPAECYYPAMLLPYVA